MSAFDINESLARARQRLEGETRAPRADRGRVRLDPRMVEHLRELLGGDEKPCITDVVRELKRRGEQEGVRAPSRGTVYQAMDKLPTRRHRVADLPSTVRSALYNFDESSEVPEAQIAFYCFNYGTLAAVSFASGLPWLALHQAAKMSGYRRKSRGLLDAALTVRRI